MRQEERYGGPRIALKGKRRAKVIREIKEVLDGETISRQGDKGKVQR